jgi:hypothetical protein
VQKPVQNSEMSGSASINRDASINSLSNQAGNSVFALHQPAALTFFVAPRNLLSVDG